MRALVDRERARDSERLSTAGEVADIGFWPGLSKLTVLSGTDADRGLTFLRMAPLMLREGRGLGEELPTYLALEWPVARMTLQRVSASRPKR